MLLTINKPQELIALDSVSDVISQGDRDFGLLQKIIGGFGKLSEQFFHSIGFSAVQVGYLKQIYYINYRSTEFFPHCRTFQHIIINPKISTCRENTFDRYEGCMKVIDDDHSRKYPRRVKRSIEIKLDYEDPNGNIHTGVKFSGFTTVVI